MGESILLLNAGSSSLKGGCYELSSGSRLFAAQADWAGQHPRFRMAWGTVDGEWELVTWRGVGPAVRELLGRLRDAGPEVAIQLRAVAHRIVHGGEWCRATMIEADLRAQIELLVELAPLHNAPALEAVREVERELGAIPQVAVFDSGFHATLPASARTYPIPWKWTSEWGIRRFGFHGLSHQYCSRRAAEWLLEQKLVGERSEALAQRMIICHLGHGCSLTAIRGGVSVDTTMGFTPLEGLMMATRSGSIDPGIITYLQARHGLTPAEIEYELNHHAGLRGVSGVSADLRELQLAADRGEPRSQLAIEMYARSICRSIGGMAAGLGGLDVIVFTAGVGENSPQIRSRVCAPLGFLGVQLDSTLNQSARPDATLSAPGSGVKVLVLATREEEVMFAQVRDLLAAGKR